MFIFVNNEGRALITQTSLFVHSSFALPELDRQANAIVTSTQVMPKPAVQVQGTLGGQNYLNVFGEDPLQIQISGIVVGRDCRSFRSAESALGVSVDFFANHGVVNRATPLRYTITGQPSRQAFLVGLTVSQDSAFTDMARFAMSLLGESLQNERPVASTGSATTTVSPSRTINSTGLIGSDADQVIASRVLSVPASALTQNGGVSPSQTADLNIDGFVENSDGVNPDSAG